MKILLIESPISPFDITTGIAALPEPLALEVLAATVPDHEVRILDMRLDRGLAEELENFQPDLVGITAVSANLDLAKKVLEKVKETDPRIKTVIGGHHVSLQPREGFENYLDVIVIGEGEETFPELIRCLDRDQPLDSVKGLAYRQDGDFHFTGERDLIEMEAMPIADRSLTKRYRRQYFRGSWRPLASIISSRGCPFRCDFCAQWKIYRGKYRIRKPETVVDELARLKERYVHFTDDNTLEDYRTALELADRIKAAGLRKVYEVYSRADTIAKHPDLIETWREIGLKLVLVGLEAIREDKLSSWNKRISLRTNEEAISILHENDVETAAYFVIDPDFGEEEFENLSAYVEEKGLTHPIFTILSPFPGTELRKKRRHELITDSYQILDFFHTVLPTRLPREEFYRHFAELYFRAYSPRKALKHIFRSKAFLSPRAFRQSRILKNNLRGLYYHHAKTSV